MADDVVRGWLAFQQWGRARRRDAETAQGLVEYALIIALVAIVLIVGLSGLAQNINNVFIRIGNNLAASV